MVLVLVVLSASVQAMESVTVAWDRSPDPNVVGYFCSYGSTSGNYTTKVNAGNATSATISGLVEGNTYFLAASGYSSAGLQSVPSNEIRYTVPLANNPPTIALTSPLSGANYTLPAAVNLAAGVAANGHTIIKVQFYSGTTLLGEATSAPYSLTWSSASPGSYSITAVVVYDGGSTVVSSPVNINVTGLPAPWQSADIGLVGVAGSASAANGLYTVQGAGTLSGTADNFHFLYQPLSGDGQITARLNSVGTPGTTGRMGVMIRESLASASKYTFMGITPGGQFDQQRRFSTGGLTSGGGSAVGTLPNVWARLVRTGDTFDGYYSVNGTSWTWMFSSGITMAANIYIGFAVASGNSNTLNSAAFTIISLVP